VKTVVALTIIYCLVMSCFMGRLTFPSQVEYVKIAKKYVPLVQAMYDYRRDHGSLPPSLGALVPNYRASVPGLPEVYYNPDVALVIHAPAPHTGITYNFDPQREGWSSDGEFGFGPMPLPKLSASAPATTRSLPQ
jgi:hypothetical protein